MGRRKTREQPGPEPFFKPQLFVTGGQTGADSIPLSVYRDLGVRVTGWMPQGFLRDDGRGAEVAQQHGFREGEGSYGWRDRANAAESDACLALLTSKPRTGKGTMQTVNIFVNGEHEFVELTKPSVADYLVIAAPAGHPWRRPVLVFWDITEAKLVAFAEVLRGWLATFRPARLMLAGPLETSWPGKSVKRKASVIFVANTVIAILFLLLLVFILFLGKERDASTGSATSGRRGFATNACAIESATGTENENKKL